MYSGVAPSSVAWLSEAPASRSSLAMSTWPCWHATSSGVKLPSAAWLTALVDRCAGLEEQPGTLDVAVLARNEAAA